MAFSKAFSAAIELFTEATTSLCACALAFKLSTFALSAPVSSKFFACVSRRFAAVSAAALFFSIALEFSLEKSVTSALSNL